jgi:hypothetical protein
MKTKNMSENNRCHEDDIVRKLSMENDFIKMKLMLEHGAVFHSGQESKPLDPATEHAFLQQVLAFEARQRKGAGMTVYEKLGCPGNIRRPADLTEEDLPNALKDLHVMLNEHGIHLSVLREDVGPREIYDFMTGEFMDVELNIHDSPGLHCFVYDAFHPKKRHENERTALEYCIRLILRKKNLQHMFPPGRPVKLNGHEGLTEQALRKRIHEFKSRYRDIVSIAAQTTGTIVTEDNCRVTGTHTTGFCEETKCSIVRGQWLVEFRRDPENDWLLTNIQIGGVAI